MDNIIQSSGGRTDIVHTSEGLYNISKQVEMLQKDVVELKKDVKKILDMMTSIYEFEEDKIIHKEEDNIQISKIYVDGCCNSDTKGNGWGSVVDENNVNLLDIYPDLLKDLKTGKVKTPKGNQLVLITKFTDVESQQNNGAELIGMVAGLRIAIKSGCKIVYSDSALITNFWSLNRITPKTKNKMDPDKYKYIQECIQLRIHYESQGGQIIKISGDDNKADLGYHK